ncbi:MAG: bifunctional riboflavin kinase/FAD synthetase [Pirellulales bacterium]|nr:bifunctional riboflavin kinase/FAD synthetase [Pirellulales bacterium]
MNVFCSLDEFPNRFHGGAVAVGNFDGIHRGHAQMLGRLKALAGKIDGPAVVFTFDPHPARLLHPEAAPLPLIEMEQKTRLLADLGIDAVLIYPTTRAFLDLSAREFFTQVIRTGLSARAMVEGPNFFFGRSRSGTIEILRQFCAEAGMRFEVTPPVEIQGRIVSSSRIRELLLEGRVEEAAQMLGRPYRLQGTVVRGSGRGARLGFPTANLDRCRTLLPRDGIYAGQARIGVESYPAAVSVGANPTFGESERKVEVYLLDFQSDLYDRPLEVDFLARLRTSIKYPSPEALVEQMARDVEEVRRVSARWSAVPG